MMTMSDLEKMISDLESMANHMYFGETVPIEEFVTLEKTVEFLKDMRPVKPQWLDDKPNCGYCGVAIPGGAKYCPNCGRAVKWDD